MVAHIYVRSPNGVPELEGLPEVMFEQQIILAVVVDDPAKTGPGPLNIFFNLDFMEMPSDYWKDWAKSMRAALRPESVSVPQRYALANVARAYHTLACLQPDRALYDTLTSKFRNLKATANQEVDATDAILSISGWINEKLGVMAPLHDTTAR